MAEKRKLFFDGRWHEGSSGEKREVINPANEEVVALVCRASETDLSQVLESAAGGFKIWSRTSPWERSKILTRCARIIEERIPALAEVMTLDQLIRNHG